MITQGKWLVMGNMRESGHFDFVLPLANNDDFQDNCRAIAAVPDMIEALRAVKELIGNGITIINDGAPDGTQPEISHVYSTIFHALAKAGIK
jgi:hypothetical protein